MQIQSPSFVVEVLTQEDATWFVEVAAVEMLTYELQRPELINLEQLYKLTDQVITAGTAFIVKKHGVPIGATAGILSPNLYNPTLWTFAELFWYVLPEYRNTRAGYLLLKALDDTASKCADDLAMSLLPSSTVDISAMEKRGFNLVEFGFKKSYGG